VSNVGAAGLGALVPSVLGAFESREGPPGKAKSVGLLVKPTVDDSIDATEAIVDSLLRCARTAHIGGRGVLAYRLYARVTRIAPDSAAAWLGRGLTALEQRRRGDARSSLLRYLELDPEGADRELIRSYLASL
jgi:hypothetical protein